MIHRLIREQRLFGKPDEIWSFFADPRNLEALTPKNLSFRTVGEVAPRMYAGQLMEHRIGLLPRITARWLTEITHVSEGTYFVDEQRIGPYRLWHHEHHFTPFEDNSGVTMRDLVTYEVGWSLAGGLIHVLWIRRELNRIFDFRHDAVEALFPRPRA